MKERRGMARMQICLQILCALLGAAFMAVVVPTTAMANNIFVGPGCSLTNAVSSANSDFGFGGCTAGSGPDTIILPPGSVHSFTTGPHFVAFYGNSALAVFSPITIQGNGA